MEDKKKKPNILKILLISFLVMYSMLYILNVSGYYNNKRKEKVVFTEEKIKEFEKDINMGKNVDINDYLEGSNKDYSNNFSRLGNSISNKVNTIFNKGLRRILKIFSKVV